MGNNHDYIALDWVKGEIKQTLSQAQIALEAYVENKEDIPQITFCLNYIHQVHGTLQMVEFYGAALLAEEMEKLCQALIEDKVASVQEALEVLMDSLLQLENYLEHIQKGQRDLPVVLLPILNDLRALQGQPLLSDTSLFTPDLSSAISVAPDITHNQRMQDEQVVANLRKLRQMFQFSLAGVIRNQDLAENFSYLYKVVSRLEKFCQGTPIGQIWWVAIGFLDAIQGDDEGVSSATKQLLRELDHQIKLMVEEQKTILAKPLPTDLLKNLLYYVAKSSTDSSRIKELKQTFSLEQALPSEKEVDEEREKLNRPGAETMSSVVEVLGEELSHVKEQLDLYVRGDEKDNANLLELVPQLTQIANTMAVLGLGVARKLVLEQITRIEEVSASGEPANDQLLMDMAGALLYVEANLSSLSDAKDVSEEEQGEFVVPAEHFESAHNAVIYESRNGLEQAKNSIVNFIASQWDHAEIEDVPDLLDSIRGGLLIIPLTQAASLLESCSTYIRDSLLTTKQIPDWQQLDRLADAITSIEYYMERLSEGAQDNDRILKVAEESVAKLGFPTGDAAEESIPVLSQHHISDVASESPDSIEKESDEGLIDEDILEIFMEEVAEVMDEIQSAMGQLRSDPEDQQALQNLRRAFHTLKGSGRLVGAKVIAEIAWPIENLLNKHLDASMSLELEVFDLLDSVIEKLPELTEDFSHQRESSHYEHLISHANMLSGNETRVVHKTITPETASQSEASKSPEAAESDAPLVEPVAELDEPTSPAEAVSEVPTDDESSSESQDTATPETAPQVDSHDDQEEDGEIEDTWDDDEDDLIDEEILEIFIEEAGEVLEAIDTHLPVYFAAHDDQDALTELRRAFHTLKGSGRMVNANIIGEAAWSIENLLNRVIDGSVMMNDSIEELIQLVVDNIPKLIECFEKRQRPDFDLKLVEKQAAALIAGDFVSPLGSLQKSKQSKTSEVSAPDTKPVEKSSMTVGIDDSLLDIFRNEAALHVASVEEFVEQANNEDADINDDLSRALHTLKGSANTANIKPIADIAVPVEQFVKDARANNIQVNQTIAEMLGRAMEFIKQGIAQLDSSPDHPLEGTEAFLADLKELQGTVFAEQDEELQTTEEVSKDPQIINIFLTEGLDILLDAESILNQWEHSPVSVKELTKLYGEVKTLHRGAKVAGLDNIAELCECLESCYGSIDIENERPSSVFINDIKRGHEALIDMMDQLAAGLTLNLDNKLLAELREHIADHSHVIEASEPSSGVDDGLNQKLDELEKELDDALPSYSSVEETIPEETLNEVDDDEIMDADLAEIFLEEANELVHGIEPALEKLKEQPGNASVILQLQRDMHTLKGGARLAGFEPVGDLTDVLEKLFEKLIDYKADASSLMLSLLEESSTALNAMLKSIEQLQPCETQDALVANISSVIDGLSSTPLLEEEIEPEPAQESEAPTAATGGGAPVLLDLDPELAEIFLEEAQEIIDSSGELLHQWESDVYNIEVVAELQRELHTLKGGARMAEINPIGDLAHELETLFESLVNKQLEATQEMTSLCLSCHDALANMVESVQQGAAINSADNLLNRIKQVTTGSPAEPVAPEPVAEEAPATKVEPAAEAVEPSKSIVDEDDLEADLLPLFIDESKDILSAAAEYIEHWREDDDSLEGIVELQREMHTLKGGARLADVDAIGDLAEAVNTRLEQMIDGQLNDPEGLYHSVAKAYQELTEMLESLIHGEELTPAPALIAEINSAGIKSGSTDTGSSSQAPTSRIAEVLGDDVDLEVLELFVEEARELIEALEEQISEWSNSPSEGAPNLEIQRILHTLKGGARLSNLSDLADESHELESRLMKAQRVDEVFEGEFKDYVLKSQDALLKLVDELEALAAGEAAPESSAKPVVTEASKKPKAAPAPKAKAASKQPKKEAKAPAKPSDSIQTAQKAAAQETIRVSAGLLDSLVNLAGETSISRGRLEQQISDFGFTLEEMSATIERLREQLRRMDMETEAQVLFRAEKEGLKAPDYEDFDPLEMDRYSSIQQLSRALTESTSDLQDLRDTLSDRAKDAETLLLQQSRINSELQEGLMKTRMIPFSSIVPRLRRIVRQIGGELDKQVDFDALNTEGEMDRSVLERMVAPLEHMLRNALDHGIETASERQKVGKAANGKITLSLMREGGNIVLKMKDDGAGINDKVVLEKAIKQGLVKKSDKPTRHEIMQFIMAQGFSTAEKVTQISGRGVGMDVVASEIKQMGGSIEIDSVLGQGTEFTIRLPFTVSVNRALMVNIGEDFYAIPLNTIEGIVRVSPYELEEYYKPDAPMYEYAGRGYQLQYLGKLLHSSHHPKLQGQPLPLPVILVRGSDKPMALQVDSLMGSREIVVKSLGPQFANVHGASGATILGDGSVVVILDLPALIRDDMAGILDSLDADEVAATKVAQTKTVMVVDDSVTVRKVTTRLLERHGYEVITAKDGVDAIATLQDHKPDVMLLDIEMPRMDGFEVATLVRHDERLQDVPIIMITSRTGQKHKERALSIGVNEYLGKPFQEHDLLENIERFIG